jgi:hypothetical protein
MKKASSILDVIDPRGESDTDERDVYTLRGKQVVSKTVEVSEIATWKLPAAAKDVVSACGFYTDGVAWFPIQVASVSTAGIVLATSIPAGATGFLSVSFTRKAKDDPMAKYVVAAVAVVAAGAFIVGADPAQMAEIAMNIMK